MKDQMTEYMPGRPTYTSDQLEAAYRKLNSDDAIRVERQADRLSALRGIGWYGSLEILAAIGELGEEEIKRLSRPRSD